MKVINVLITPTTTTIVGDKGEILLIPYYKNLTEALYSLMISNICSKGYFECNPEDLSTEAYIRKFLKDNKIDCENIPVEKIEPVVKEAVVSGNAEGLQLFMNKLKKVNAARKFSVDSCIDFLKHNDMPITVEGNILGYKWLYKTKDPTVFTDTYSCKITQRVRSLVCCSQKDVDPNRDKECSYGLHVASREYAEHYYGDYLALVLVHPEDIISVPNNDHSKVRVMQYLILYVFDKEQSEELCKNGLTDKELTYWVNAADNYSAVEQVFVDCKKNTCTVTPINHVETVVNKPKKKVKASRVTTTQDKTKKNDVRIYKYQQIHALVEKWKDTGYLTKEQYKEINDYRIARHQSLSKLFPDLNEEVFWVCYSERMDLGN